MRPEANVGEASASDMTDSSTTPHLTQFSIPVGSGKRATDVARMGLPELDWSDRASAIEALYQFTISRTNETIRWYIERRQSKRSYASWLRGIAILCATLAAILPVLIGLIPPSQVAANLSPLPVLFVALAVGVLQLDRFYGHSSAWMRFISTELELRAQLNRFQLDWMQTRLRHGAGPIARDQTEELLSIVRAFIQQVDQILEAETRQWIEEFKGSIAEFDKLIHVQQTTAAGAMERGKSGALKVTLLGMDQVDGGRCQVQVEDRPAREYSTGPLVWPSLPPGLVRLTVSGLRGGQPFALEDSANVLPGVPTETRIQLG